MTIAEKNGGGKMSKPSKKWPENIIEIIYWGNI
jgi:hypothetical protein